MRVADEFRRLWQGIRLFSLISWFHLFKVSGNVIDRREGVIEQQIAKLMSRRILAVLGMKVTTEGLENAKHLDNYAVASNHLSYLDWVLILAEFPNPVSFIAKRAVTLMPVFGSYLRNRGVLIDRRKGHTARSVIRGAAGNNPFPLLIFPEGTRSPDGEPQKFRRAGVRILTEQGLKLLPVVLFGTYEGLSKHARCIKTGLHLHLLILPPIDPKEIGETEACEELERVITETYLARRDEFGSHGN